MWTSDFNHLKTFLLEIIHEWVVAEATTLVCSFIYDASMQKAKWKGSTISLLHMLPLF